MGIEPTSSAWEAEVLPLTYTRMGLTDFFHGRYPHWSDSTYLSIHFMLMSSIHELSRAYLTKFVVIKTYRFYRARGAQGRHAFLSPLLT